MWPWLPNTCMVAPIRVRYYFQLTKIQQKQQHNNISIVYFNIRITCRPAPRHGGWGGGVIRLRSPLLSAWMPSTNIYQCAHYSISISYNPGNSNTSTVCSNIPALTTVVILLLLQQIIPPKSPKNTTALGRKTLLVAL